MLEFKRYWRIAFSSATFSAASAQTSLSFCSKDEEPGPEGVVEELLELVERVDGYHDEEGHGHHESHGHQQHRTLSDDKTR